MWKERLTGFKDVTSMSDCEVARQIRSDKLDLLNKMTKIYAI